MIYFFGNESNTVFAVATSAPVSAENISKLNWLFGNTQLIEESVIADFFVGPRPSMITPWSTNAVEITQNMGIPGLVRIESFRRGAQNQAHDPMLEQQFTALDQHLFDNATLAQPIQNIEDISAFNQSEGLALNQDEVAYLEDISKKIGRPLTDSEVFGFSQINSEHCRHKIFNGKFVIDGVAQTQSLFGMIRETSKQNPNNIVSAYKDNVAFIKGPEAIQFAPKSADKPDFYQTIPFESVLSLKAETHNFPTTVEPFNGAATGSGGEIRDRLAGGQGSLPLAGTAVYMTAYPRLEPGRSWEEQQIERPWLYQTPLDILIKASNGATDFGNKFGQPLIAGSVLTFEHREHDRHLGYDKVIMQAGGVGYGKATQAQKKTPSTGDKIVVMGGENYRIGMGGAAVSSADTGALGSGIERNAIQRSNPEMQKRVANAIRGMVESDYNPIISIHDHGAGGHLNCLSELVEHTGGDINLDCLPVGDPSMSAKEIIGNESQERMGLVISESDLSLLQTVAERERAPLYEVGEITTDARFKIQSERSNDCPMDFALSDLFGSSPQTVIEDQSIARTYEAPVYDDANFETYLQAVLQLESVACKDWLTNKVDRCVGGRVAKQQCVGPLQLPLNNVGVMALDFESPKGVATSIGHHPIAALTDAEAGSRLAIAEALSNIVWAPLEEGLKSVSLSANWMWPCNNPGEDARLYQAVKACSDYAISLGINIPTGKDSLSMKQKYADKDVLSPGTVIISAAAPCFNINSVVEPLLKKEGGLIYYVSFSAEAPGIGGSAFAQSVNKIGGPVPQSNDAPQLKRAFETMQQAINNGWVQAGHDIGSGGLITTLLELCFADNELGAIIDLAPLNQKDSTALLFSENPGLVFQADAKVEALFEAAGVNCYEIGSVQPIGMLEIKNGNFQARLEVASWRDVWFKTSYLLDKEQSGAALAKKRYANYKNQPLRFTFPQVFDGKRPQTPSVRPKAAIIREKGSNSEREMANAMYLAGFDVKDVHMTDLVSGREDLKDIQFIGAVGGFSNSDVLGSAKGWAGAFLYNQKARQALDDFFARPDTLSVGICNGCQLFVELELITPGHEQKPRMRHNDSGKHESSFTSVRIQDNHSVMLHSLAGTTLGVWVSHGEGKFELPYEESRYDIVAKYAYEEYPANPNGSHYNVAMMCDSTGRHLVTMPHIERSVFQWNWASYPESRNDEVTPWVEAFVNARLWLEERSRKQ